MRRLVLLGSLLLAGCGSPGGRPARQVTMSSPDGTPRARSVLHRPSRPTTRAGAALGLRPTSQPTIERACRKAARAAGATVYCPPLAPAGPVQVLGVDGLRRSRDFRDGLILNFASRSVNSSTQPGHWSYAQGRSAALSELLRPAEYDPALAPTATTASAIGHVPVKIELMPFFRVFHWVYGGHVVVAWSCRGTAYQVSMHGHHNLKRARLMAVALIAEMLPCTR